MPLKRNQNNFCFCFASFACKEASMFIQIAGSSCTLCAHTLYCYLSHEMVSFRSQAMVTAKHTVHVAWPRWRGHNTCGHVAVMQLLTKHNVVVDLLYCNYPLHFFSLLCLKINSVGEMFEPNARIRCCFFNLVWPRVKVAWDFKGFFCFCTKTNSRTESLLGRDSVG